MSSLICKRLSIGDRATIRWKVGNDACWVIGIVKEIGDIIVVENDELVKEYIETSVDVSAVVSATILEKGGK